MKWLLVASQILILLAATLSESTELPPGLKGINSYDPLQDNYLVVRGTVSEVVRAPITLADWGIKWGTYLEAWRVSLNVTGVLKGELNQKVVTLTLPGNQSPIAPGDDVIVCPRWRDTKSGGTFVINPYLGIYVENDSGRWAKRTSDYMIEPMEILAYAEIMTRIRKSSLESVTAASDVIVHGIIVSKWEADYRSEDGRLGAMTHYKLRVSELLKGRASGDFIEFVVPRVKEYVPQWYRQVPFGIDVGQEWLVFLRKGDRGLYPFAGPSGVLQIKGDDLIFDMTVTYPHTLPEAARIIHSELSQ